MTEEKMQEARRAFLVDTLRKLLGQDSPTGFTDRAVDGRGGHRPGAGLCHPAHQQGQPGGYGARPGDRTQGGPVRPRGHPGPDGALRRRQRHAHGHQGGRPAAAHAGRRILPHLHPRGQGVHRHGALPLARRSMCLDDAATRPRDEKNMAVRIDEKVHGQGRTCRPWASRPATTSATTPRPPSPTAAS